MKKQTTGSNEKLIEQQSAQERAIQNTLSKYAQQLNEWQTTIDSEHVLSLKHGKVILELAVKAGGVLRDAKELVPSGKWETWLTNNVKGITVRTAQNYMRLAKKLAKEKESVPNPASDSPVEAKHVSFLDDVDNLREAYIAVGILKKKAVSEKDGNGDGERTPSPQQVKKDNPKVYEETLAQVRELIGQVVPGIIKDHKEANWDVPQWAVDENGKPPFRHNGTALCLDKLVAFIACCSHNKQITQPDETQLKAAAVFRELFKAMIRATRPEAFVMEFNDKNVVPFEVAEKLAA